MRIINQIIAFMLWVVGSGMLSFHISSLFGVLFFAIFTLWPHALTHLGIFLAKSSRSHTVLLVAMLGYFCWFAYAYVDIFCTHVDPQGAVALLFIGVSAMPVMTLLWY